MAAYPWKAEDPRTAFGAEVVVCDVECAEAAGVWLIDELTDGWIEATEESRCPGCGRLIIIGGALTGAHVHENTSTRNAQPPLERLE